MGLKVYVASKYEEKERTNEIMTLLKMAGHQITHDWTATEQASRTQAILDLRGVADCDVYVGIFEKDLPYRGALVEMGAALALGKPVYLLGNSHAVTKNIFAKHPNVRRTENAFVRDLLGGAVEW